MPRTKQFDEEEVLKRAMTLFWKKGYHNTSIKDLIQSLGISNASIYHSFGGKKQLFNRAIAYYREVNIEGLRQFLETQLNVREGLIQVFQKIIEEDRKDDVCKGCFIVNSTTELIPAEDDFTEVIQAHKQEIEKIFFDFLQKGVHTGQISPQKELMTISRLLYTLMTGLRVLGKAKSDPKEFTASVEAVLSLLG